MLRYAVCDAEGLDYNDETKKQYLDEFGFTEDLFNQYLDENEQQEAVIWYLAGKTIVDNGKVNYVEETEADTEAAETDAAENTAAAESETAKTE